MAEELYEALRNEIIDGHMKPNERVVEEAIAARSGVSRTPVREALHRLEIDGLVRTSAHGTTVVEFTAEELAETCAVRDVLEALAAERAASFRTELDVAMLEELTRDFEKAVGGDVNRVIELNHAFHDAVWEASRNTYLVRELECVRALIERRDCTTLEDEDRQREAVAEHRQILEAIGGGDSDAARAATLNHFRHASARRILARRALVRKDRR